MNTLLAVGREVLADLVKLRLPVTAGAAAVTIVAQAELFGLDLSDQTKRITAGLTLLGLVVTYVQKLRERTS